MNAPLLARPAWIAEFEATHGRAPRVLHVGNIANNAYNNAKLLRAAGVDCDVLCYDYYHIMGCPEWEDADFDGAPSDQFQPDWTSVDLRGYMRPAWFAQGPDSLAIEYLIARGRGEARRAALLWDALALANRTRSRSSLKGGTARRWHAAALCTLARIELAYRKLTAHPEPNVRVHTRLAMLGVRGSALELATAVCYGAVMLVRRVDSIFNVVRRSRAGFAERAASLVARFRREFPQRADALEIADLERYARQLPRLRTLFSQYDLVQGYATDPILPLMVGVRYVALEHGTLREIPAQPTSDGRVTALSYRLAGHVFVTNHDCLETARLLAPDRVTFINHPFDERDALRSAGWEALRMELQRQAEARFLFFFPTRQDWAPGKSTADKANDIFLRAFCELRRAGYPVGLIACEWGLDLADSKRLLAEEGVERHARWVPPMGMMRFWRFARACDVVVDQFKFGALGGVAFKALAAGAPLLTYLEESAIRAIYPENPPVINCRSTAEIVESMRSLIADRAKLARLAEASRRWIERHHAGVRTIELQLAAYGKACSIPHA